MNKKYAKVQSTRRSLIMSILSLMLCFAMLIGTTYAWFTDSVTSGKNRIVAGNLDVELTHNNGSGDKTVQDATDLFSTDLWEPGKVVYENFTVKNVGTLAFKYTMVLSKWNFNTVKGTDKSLADVIKVAIVPGGYTPATSGDPRAALLADSNITFGSLIQEGTNDIYKIDSDTTGMGILYPADNTPEGGKTSETFGVILYWEPSEIDNYYNLNNGKKSSDGKPLFLELGVNLVATQYTYEADSFNNQYDKDTVLPVIGTKTQAAKKAENGTYTFENDKYVEQGEQKQAPATVIPQNTTFYTSHDKTDANKVEEASGENVTGELNRKVETTKEYVEETQQTVIDLDISFTYTTKTTTASGTTEETKDVKAFSNVIEYSAPVGTGFAVKSVTHNGVAMTKATDTTTKADQTWFYNYDTGILYVWSSTYSKFEAIGNPAVASISNTSTGKVIELYTKLSDANAAWEDGTTLKILKNLDGQLTTSSGTKVYDMNGYKLKNEVSVLTVSGGNVTIKDSDTANKGELYCVNTINTANPKPLGGLVVTGGEVTVESGKISGTAQSEGCAVYVNAGKVTFNGGSAEAGEEAVYVDNGEVIVNGGTITGGKSDNGGESGAMTLEGAGKITIAGGNINGFRGDAVTNNLGSKASNSTVIITGGTFNFDPSSQVKKGYKVAQTGDVWTVSRDESYNPVAKIGETEYNTLQEAFEAAQTGDTITLLRDTSETVNAVYPGNNLIELGKAIKTMIQGQLDGKTDTEVGAEFLKNSYNFNLMQASNVTVNANGKTFSGTINVYDVTVCGVTTSQIKDGIIITS